MAILIPTSQNRFAVVDDEDAERVLKKTWTLMTRHCRTGLCYAVNGRNSTEKQPHNRVGLQLLHRFILELPKGQGIVDHINRDGLDCRKSNLRVVDFSSNTINRIYESESGFRGIYRSSSKKWRARLYRYGKIYTSKTLPSAELAARAYDEIAKIHHGEFAVLNFPVVL